MENKRGQIVGMLYFFGALFILLFLGFIIAIGVSVTDYVADETVPELTNMGNTEFGNLSEIAGYTITPANNFLQALPLISGVLYVLMLVATLGLAYGFRVSGERWMLFLFFGLAVILILAAMGISIIYEDFYDDAGELGDRLKEQALLSFLILYSPAILTVIAFVGAIIMFTGFEEVVS